MALTTQPAKLEVTSPISFGDAMHACGQLVSGMFARSPILTIVFAIVILLGIHVMLTSPPAKKRRRHDS